MRTLKVMRRANGSAYVCIDGENITVRLACPAHYDDLFSDDEVSVGGDRALVTRTPADGVFLQFGPEE